MPWGCLDFRDHHFIYVRFGESFYLFCIHKDDNKCETSFPSGQIWRTVMENEQKWKNKPFNYELIVSFKKPLKKNMSPNRM